MAPTILYFVVGVFWVGILVAGGRRPALLGGSHVLPERHNPRRWDSSWLTRPLTKATAVFGLALTLYQVYVALTHDRDGPRLGGAHQRGKSSASSLWSISISIRQRTRKKLEAEELGVVPKPTHPARHVILLGSIWRSRLSRTAK